MQKTASASVTPIASVCLVGAVSACLLWSPPSQAKAQPSLEHLDSSLRGFDTLTAQVKFTTTKGKRVHKAEGVIWVDRRGKLARQPNSLLKFKGPHRRKGDGILTTLQRHYSRKGALQVTKRLSLVRYYQAYNGIAAPAAFFGYRSFASQYDIEHRSGNMLQLKPKGGSEVENGHAVSRVVVHFDGDKPRVIEYYSSKPKPWLRVKLLGFQCQGSKCLANKLEVRLPHKKLRTDIELAKAKVNTKFAAKTISKKKLESR